GYEEAAGQGLIGGANAALRALDREPIVLERDRAFIGVLLDDLVTKGTDEPYRLFTSRAEFRLTLRQDNALQRLGPIAAERGLLSDEQIRAMEDRWELAERVTGWLAATNATPEQANPVLAEAQSSPVSEPTRLSLLLRRPNVRGDLLVDAVGGAPEAERHLLLDAIAGIEIEAKYDGYLKRERARATQLQRQAEFPLPSDLPWTALHSLSFEARQKLDRIRPATLAQAARVPGVSPADIQNLVMEVRKRGERLRLAAESV
ncbi:MAG TPA: tRNA uridine-5-carboxymethylaminomethyl(34) synthesis enzyme MnmG, partial [Longimicrobium sp.]